MAKQTLLNQKLWKRDREWCYTCEAWVVPTEKMGGNICPKCRRATDPKPESTTENTPK